MQLKEIISYFGNLFGGLGGFGKYMTIQDYTTNLSLGKSKQREIAMNLQNSTWIMFIIILFNIKI